MKITVIGAGPVGTALGSSWSVKGHEVTYGARNPGSDKVLNALTMTRHGKAADIAQAVAWADCVVLATPWAGTEEALRTAGNFAGKTLLDATNPLTPSFSLALGFNDSGAEQIQRWAPSAKVVKVFNSTGFENMANPVYPTGRAAMVFCGNDLAAKDQAAQLAGDLGFEPLDMGALTEARHLEPAAMVWIKLAIVQKLGRHIAFGLMRR